MSEGERSVVVRASRFGAAAAIFTYGDGITVRQEARSGDFASYWRIGGTLLFTAPQRNAPLVMVAIGFRNADWEPLLNAQIIAQPQAGTSDRTSMIIGATLALLVLSILVNLAAGLGLRRAEPLWNAAWAACVLGWALMWTQAILLVAPSFAGSPAARVGTACATMAIVAAGAHLLAAAPLLPNWIKGLLRSAMLLVLVSGLGAALCAAAWLPTISMLLNAAVLIATVAVVVASISAWKASPAVRRFAWSFLLPIGTVLWSTFYDQGVTADDPRGMYLVLVACSLQILWLALASTREVFLVRQDRDLARASEAQLAKIAETDPLTGLLNRRGFIRRAEDHLSRGKPVSLVHLDLDHFKTINDVHGHQVGDGVLQAVATILLKSRAIDGSVAGRLGGEEFGLLVKGDAGRGVLLAEHLRLLLANLPIAVEGVSLDVTASFGVAESGGADSWNALYKNADDALYVAKLHGRNLVRSANRMSDLTPSSSAA